jgi:glucose/arabinose dehydrogenase
LGEVVKRRRTLAVVLVGAAAVLGACGPLKTPTKPGPPGGGGGARQLLPPPPDAAAPPNSPTLTKINLVTGLSNPWDVAFLGDGTMYFDQRSGPIQVRLTDGTINNIVTPSDIAASGESGMLGLAVDPNFGANKFIYACYTATNDNRVVRWQVNNTFNGVVAQAGTPLMTGAAKASFHDGCRVRFGPDGKLWVTMGDGGVGSLPQNLESLNGKILRLNPDGTVPSDNPFNSFVWTYGHRNPQGIAFQPGTGQPYCIEHGPNINDEVNRLVPGGNGGWDPVPGYNQAVPMTDLQRFPDAMIPAWRSGDSFTVAPSGGTFLTGSQWKSWKGALVVAFLKDSKARVMFFDGNGNVSFATKILENGIRLRSAVEGPDGNLYITTDAGGGNDAIWKVTPS